MPRPEVFTSEENYYATLFHELAHSTDHKSRLDRKSLQEKTSFGSTKYAREELVAEMTSAFLCAQAHIEKPVIENAAAYISGWLRTLKDDPKLVVVAASQAQKAADFILRK